MHEVINLKGQERLGGPGQAEELRILLTFTLLLCAENVLHSLPHQHSIRPNYVFQTFPSLLFSAFLSVAETATVSRKLFHFCLAKVRRTHVSNVIVYLARSVSLAWLLQWSPFSRAGSCSFSGELTPTVKLLFSCSSAHFRSARAAFFHLSTPFLTLSKGPQERINSWLNNCSQ